MKKKKSYFIMIFIGVLLLSFMSLPANAQSQQQTLNQYIADLQKNPDDNALREKIIKHVQAMKPKPAIPETAREHYVMATTFIEKAKDSAGYERAIEEYKAALLAAPWWSATYKKLAIVQKAAAKYEDAINSLNLYILTQPADTRDAKDEIYKLKALQKEQQQSDAPKVLFGQLKQQYEGVIYTMLNCSHARESVCFEEVGMFPCGCNEAELGGTTWYSGGRGTGRILFPNDGTIVLYGDSQYPEIKGTPKGPNISDIVWERSVVYADGHIEWKPIWVRLDGYGLDRILFSPGHDNFGAPSRPVDEGLYQQNKRYYYRLYRRQ